MGSLLGAFILFFTVFAAVASGILTAYGSILGILFLLAPRTTESSNQPSVLLPNQASAAHAGGD